MKKVIFFYTLVIGFFSVIMISCIHSLPDSNSMREICFTTEVLPIFQSSCAISGCHSSGGEFALDSYTSIMKHIEAGNPKNSDAYQAIISKWINVMPPDKPLPQDARTIIRIWIEQGAKNTTCSDTVPVVDNSACFSRDILPILSSSCSITGCHDAITAAGDYNLSNYSNLISSGLVNSGNAATSKFYTVLSSGGENRMPQSPNLPLTTDQKNLIAKWINEGATNNVCVSLCDITVFTYSGAIEQIIVNNCKGCHSGATPQKGVSLTNYAEVKAIADDGRLNDVIKALNGKAQMPPSGKLIDCKITQIDEWIAANSPNN